MFDLLRMASPVTVQSGISVAGLSARVFVVKRGDGKGNAGIVNALFYGDNCNMVYGNAQAVLVHMIEAVRGLSAH